MEKMMAQRTREAVAAVRGVERRTRRLVEDELAARYRAATASPSRVVAGVREQVRGDDARAIDARATARTGVPHVRTLAEERARPLVLMVDIGASGAVGSGRSGKRELAAEALAALAFSAVSCGDRVGLLLFTDRVELFLPPRLGREHVRRILRAILLVEPRGRRTDLEKALDHANRLLKGRSLLLLASDFLLAGPIDQTAAALRRRLRATSLRHDLVAVSVTDPRELRLPDLGVISLEDLDTGEEVEIDTSSAEAREAYRRAADRYYAEIGRTIRASGVDEIRLSTAEPPAKALMAFLASRGRTA